MTEEDPRRIENFHANTLFFLRVIEIMIMIINLTDGLRQKCIQSNHSLFVKIAEIELGKIELKSWRNRLGS